MSDFRIHSRTRNYRGGFSGCYGGGRKDYIFSVPKCREFFKYNRCVFFGVYRFTGKRGFVCCEVVRCDKTAVCGNKIACRYYKYITGNNVRGRNIKLIAVSEYTGMGEDSFFKASRLFSARFS